MSTTNNPGGRPKGSVNKLTQEMREAIEKVEGFIDPAFFLASVLANAENSVEVRMEAAKQLMPFRYPKLRQTEVSGPDGGPLEITGATFSVVSPKRKGESNAD